MADLLICATFYAGGSMELKYTHFSVIMNGDRRLAFVSAANIDGENKISLKRPK